MCDYFSGQIYLLKKTKLYNYRQITKKEKLIKREETKIFFVQFFYNTHIITFPSI